MDALSNFIPPNSRRYSFDAATKILLERDSQASGASDYRAFLRYVGERKTSLAELNEALTLKEFQYKVETGGANTPAVKVDAASRQRLELTRDALSRPLPPEEQEAIGAASSALVNYFIQQLNP